MRKDNVIDDILNLCTRCMGENFAIEWVGSGDGKYALDWPEFSKRFANTRYQAFELDLPRDLVVVGKGPDGSSWGIDVEYDDDRNNTYLAMHQIPTRKEGKPFDFLINNRGGRSSFEEIQDIGGNPDKEALRVKLNGLIEDEKAYIYNNKLYFAAANKPEMKIPDWLNEEIKQGQFEYWRL